MNTWAITGGIGSGKSVISSILRARGYQVFDTDSIAKKIMQQSSNLRNALIHTFGSNCFLGDELNRSYLASLVFSNDENLKVLNTLVHPLVKKELVDLKNEMLKKGESYFFFECAILMESHLDEIADKILLVTADEESRICRVINRDHISREAVLERMSKQIRQDDLLKIADFTIYNNEGTTIEMLNREIDYFLSYNA